MKKIIALLLAVVLTVPFLASCTDTQPVPTAETASESAKATETTPEAQPSPSTDTPLTPTPSETEDVPSETTVDDGYKFIDDDDRSDIPVVKEHQMRDYLPSSYTLVGTKHLPPIDNQGGIGSCASEGITYMQFTNAVSRYIDSIGIDPKWNPASGNEAYIFAPKFTYNFAGAGTAWVYDILRDHGAMLLKDWHFYTTPSGYKLGTDKNNRNPKSLDWPVKDGQLEGALNYRISDYEQIWSRTYGDQLTDSEAGQALIKKIKDAVVQGNVVVTGGFSSNWQYAYVTAEDAEAGTGKIGEAACVWCNGTKGGHQVSIVGYDDDFVCTLNGVQLKGAFQVANSWGETWMNDGFFWVMYDSINKVSEHPELNDKEKYEGRVNSMDQFCFIYWDKDIEIGLPEAYVSVEMTITDREGFYVELTKTDASDVSSVFMPSVFLYGMNFNNTRGSRDTLDEDDKYVTFSGKIDRPAETGILTFGFQGLTGQYDSFEDFLWGINIISTSVPLTIKKVSLYDKTGTQRASVTFPEDVGTLQTGESRSIVFDEGKQPKQNHYIGSYFLKNVNSGKFVTLKGLLLIPATKNDDPQQFDVTFDYFERYHVIMKENYVLDIRGTYAEDGKPVQFNAVSKKRDTQSWRVVDNKDGTFTVRLGVNTDYAVGMKDDKVVLVSGKDIFDYGRWYFENASNGAISLTVRYNDQDELTVQGKLPSRIKADSVAVSVYGEDGTFVQTVDAEVKEGVVSQAVTGLAKGNYLFVFRNAKGQYISSCYYASAK
ncbi:MAG: hypothetical protein IJU52_02460 [Clostridia bacterium]|nr:hypothetical protein [Clostridia bacterium]